MLAAKLQQHQKTSGTKYDPIQITHVKLPPSPLPPAHALVAIHCAALNHRDVYIREGLYPAVTDGSILGSDASGTIEASSSGLWAKGDRVLVNPARGWISQQDSPEAVHEFNILGLLPEQGTFAQFISVHQDDLAPLPRHLSFEQGSALPLAGLTAYRAVVTLGKCKAGDKVLIPGKYWRRRGSLCPPVCSCVGRGGVGDFIEPDKIAQAMALGARGGVSYKDDQWPAKLNSASGASFNLVIDGASGPNLSAYIRLMELGGTLCIYGAVAGSNSTFTVPFLWFKHLTIKGVCMGSRQEFQEMVAFVAEKKIVPVVHAVFKGLGRLDDAFDVMRAGSQMGKLVVSEIQGGLRESRL
ncbi:hypothetical protein CcCBS67573_g06247 [Chytriomyces confervae]|uniref:Enoyl reductase (ER) domain-containing protein n=1 Tax=Chytriomyces confervae TaxID=246404 RepID=A0A507F5A3_9FUNG|nr:hypothetical protein CcCBS67573_g06247 [Chytriomyces confervae]